MNYELSSLTVRELNKICRERQIMGFSRLKKPEVIKAIFTSFEHELVAIAKNDKSVASQLEIRQSRQHDNVKYIYYVYKYSTYEHPLLIASIATSNESDSVTIEYLFNK
jgi:hypothetical protein